MISLAPFQGGGLDKVCLEGDVKFFRNKIQLDFYLLDPKHLVSDSIGVETNNSKSGRRRDELWKNTCFELFWSESNTLKYWELNLAANGDWNCYEFERYRSVNPPKAFEGAFLEAFSSGYGRLTCELRFPSWGRAMEASLCAVLRGSNSGAIADHYYSSCHKDKKPDFHLRESFNINREVL